MYIMLLNVVNKELRHHAYTARNIAAQSQGGSAAQIFLNDALRERE